MKRTFIALQREEARIMLWTALRQRIQKPVIQVSLGLVGTVVLIAALGILVLRPTILTISGLIKEIQNERRLVGALDDKLRSLVTAQARLEDMKDDLPKLDWAIPAGQEFEIFVKEVEILAKQKGLASLEISQGGFNLVGPDGKTNRVKSLEVGAVLGGSEAAVREFLADLIKMDRLVVFKSVNVSSVPKDGRQEEPYQVRGSVTVEILYSSENLEDSDSQKVGN